MSKKIEEPAPETPAPVSPTVTLTLADLRELIVDAARGAASDKVAAMFTAKTHDERVTAALEEQRGKGRPQAPEFLVPCLSPLTGARFTARLITSRSIGTRVVELLDYQRPDGWDRKKADGGIVEDGDQMPLQETDGKVGIRYSKWLYETFLMRDQNAIGGQPLPDAWRIDRVISAGSVTLTSDELARLGLDAAQVKAALASETAAP